MKENIEYLELFIIVDDTKFQQGQENLIYIIFAICISICRQVHYLKQRFLITGQLCVRIYLFYAVSKKNRTA